MTNLHFAATRHHVSVEQLLALKATAKLTDLIADAARSSWPGDTWMPVADLGRLPLNDDTDGISVFKTRIHDITATQGRENEIELEGKLAGIMASSNVPCAGVVDPATGLHSTPKELRSYSTALAMMDIAVAHHNRPGAQLRSFTPLAFRTTLPAGRCTFTAPHELDANLKYECFPQGYGAGCRLSRIDAGTLGPQIQYRFPLDQDNEAADTVLTFAKIDGGSASAGPVYGLSSVLKGSTDVEQEVKTSLSAYSGLAYAFARLVGSTVETLTDDIDM
jgi:hypothetical protein